MKSRRSAPVVGRSHRSLAPVKEEQDNEDGAEERLGEEHEAKVKVEAADEDHEAEDHEAEEELGPCGTLEELRVEQELLQLQAEEDHRLVEEMEEAERLVEEELRAAEEQDVRLAEERLQEELRLESLRLAEEELRLARIARGPVQPSVVPPAHCLAQYHTSRPQCTGSGERPSGRGASVPQLLAQYHTSRPRPPKTPSPRSPARSRRTRRRRRRTTHAEHDGARGRRSRSRRSRQPPRRRRRRSQTQEHEQKRRRRSDKQDEATEQEPALEEEPVTTKLERFQRYFVHEQLATASVEPVTEQEQLAVAPQEPVTTKPGVWRESVIQELIRLMTKKPVTPGAYPPSGAGDQEAGAAMATGDPDEGMSDLVQNLVAEGMPIEKANELRASLLEQGRLRETRPTGMARKDARRPSGAGDARRPQEPVTLAGEQTRRSGAGVLEAFWSLQAAHRRRRGGGS